MAGDVLNLRDIIVEDQLGCRIAQYWMEWNSLRQEWLTQRDEIRRYVYATDTTKTSNSKLPWKNKTTIPKLCQIRDNLFANYMASLFPKRKWLVWEGSNEESNGRPKREAIEAYISWCLDQPRFKKEVAKMVLDFIDYGNPFGTVEWIDETVEVSDVTGEVKVGYIGPAVRRISPLDIVFNPIASSFESSPKIVRSWVTLGEVKELLERESAEDKTPFEELFRYIKGIRETVQGFSGEIGQLNDYYAVDGFSSFGHYLQSDYVELLTFYGDVYDYHTDTFLKNHVITVVDRHKVIHKAPNPSYFGQPPIWHVGWRVRQDNLWAMGPLDNLVGMQYRVDHIENLKADCFDLITFPPLKVKGQVDDFRWGPFERIYVGEEGDVEMLAPPFQVLQANIEIENLENKMEQMAGAPKEAMGFRTPGEKTMYEVQRLENAAARIFQSKITQFEEQFLEPLINAMLEMGRRMMTSASIKVVDDEFKVATFTQLTADDIAGSGRIKPIAARNFAEKAERVQNLNNFFQSAIGTDPDIKAHFSSIKLAEIFEELLDLADYNAVLPYVRLSEQAEAQRYMQASQEQQMMEMGTPSGLSQDDFEGEDIAAEEPIV